MPLFTSLTALSQTPGANPPDGGSDAPSTIDDNLRLLGSFSALLRDAAHVYAGSIAGTNTITGTISSNPTSYTTGQAYRFIAAANNTGAVTLNFNSLGAKSLVKMGASATPLTSGDLVAGGVYEVVYDGTQFQLVGVFGRKWLAASNGYRRSPDGFIEQWGSALSSGAFAGNVSVAFPISFPNACLNIVATPLSTGSAADIGVQIGSASATGVAMTTVQNATFVSGIGLFWRAIGY